MCAVAGAMSRRFGAISELDVTGTPVFLFVKEACRDRILRKRLQRERRNEFSRIVRHHDKNIVTLFDQQTRQLSRFVGGDRAGDAEHDAFRPGRIAELFARSPFAFSFGVSAFMQSVLRSIGGSNSVPRP